MPYKIDDIFSALADSNRRNMLVILAGESRNVNNIAEHFKISRPAVSRHLKILRKSKLVSVKKEGRERYFSINPKPMNEVFNWLKFYEKFWNEKLVSLKQYLEK